MSQRSATPDPTSADDPLRSVHTPSFAHLLHSLGVSLLVTTYQAGKLVVVRSDGERINTHFRNLPVPMGLAVDGNRLAVGTKSRIWEFQSAPSVATRLKPAGTFDACFLPRIVHHTGNILIHEMAWAGTELWFVNTRFSCLCTLDRNFSFVPRWRPRFVSKLAAEDRCHLNGVGLVSGKPRFVTAHGESDEPAGWRNNKALGGILIDVLTGETAVRGLSMPHSPRWHGERLWLLDSGSGTLGTVDLSAGRYTPVLALPGFTRGLDFAGPYAFVGLSKVRQSAVFSGLPITEESQERACGVWAIDVRSGQIAGFLRFEDSVAEIFAVQVLSEFRHPELFVDDNAQLDDAFIVPGPAIAGTPSTL